MGLAGKTKLKTKDFHNSTVTVSLSSRRQVANNNFTQPSVYTSMDKDYIVEDGDSSSSCTKFN